MKQNTILRDVSTFIGCQIAVTMDEHKDKLRNYSKFNLHSVQWHIFDIILECAEISVPGVLLDQIEF